MRSHINCIPKAGHSNCISMSNLQSEQVNKPNYWLTLLMQRSFKLLFTNSLNTNKSSEVIATGKILRNIIIITTFYEYSIHPKRSSHLTFVGQGPRVSETLLMPCNY